MGECPGQCCEPPVFFLDVIMNDTLVECYVHGEKESYLYRGEKAGFTDQRLQMFSFAGTEHKILYSVDSKGKATPVKIDDKMICQPGQAIIEVK